MRGLLLLLCGLLMLGAAAAPVAERWANGFRLITCPTTSSQVVSIEVLIDYSAFDEPPACQGIRHVLVTSMLQGSPLTSGAEIQRSLASVGGVISGRVHQDALEFSVTVPAGAVAIGMDALAEIICHPALSDRGIRQAIRQAQETATAPATGALEAASRMTYRRIYADHPYASFSLGTPETLSRLTPAMVRLAYWHFVAPDASVMAIVGRVRAVDGQARARAVFADWETRKRLPRFTIEAPTLPTSQLELNEEPVSAACVMLSFPACGATNPDFLTLRLIDVLLGGGTGARLFRSVREKYHLAYEVSTYFPSQALSSHFSLYALTAASRIEQTKGAMTAEITRLQTTPVSDAELQRAKAYMKGRYLLSHQYSTQQAFDLAWYELLGVGVGYDQAFASKVDAITSTEVARVARQYFTHYLLTVVIPNSVNMPNETIGSLGDSTARVQKNR